MLNFQSSINMFLETKFRDISNSQRGKGKAAGLRAASTIESVSNLLKDDALKAMVREKGGDTRERGDTISKTEAGMLGANKPKSPKQSSKLGEPEEQKKMTHTFQPVSQLQMTKDPIKLQKEHLANLQPLRRDDTIIEINLRSIVNMDNEPMYF